MKLPAPLARAMENELSHLDRRALSHAVEELSNRYRKQSKDMDLGAGTVSSEIERAAYLVTRMPATYAAIHAVLRELKERMPALEVRSLLDLGAGPGTAVWAAAEIFSELEQVTLIERSSGFLRLGQKLAESSPVAAMQTAHWVEADLARERELPAHDLVLISYALGELGPSGRVALMASAWQSAAKVLAVIEPGTPRGFQLVLAARDELLRQKAHLVAPCPHERQCPMAIQSREDTAGDLRQAGTSGCATPEHQDAHITKTKSDWCHFAQRLERTALHRRLKAGELGYEDEKFSYIVAAKNDVAQAAARVIRHPIQLKGHIKLELCTPQGLKQETVTRSQGDVFKAARKTRWGEAWEPEPQ